MALPGFIGHRFSVSAEYKGNGMHSTNSIKHETLFNAYALFASRERKFDETLLFFLHLIQYCCPVLFKQFCAIDFKRIVFIIFTLKQTREEQIQQVADRFLGREICDFGIQFFSGRDTKDL